MSDTRILRNTRQRKVILEELQKVSSHPSALILYNKVRQRLPKVSLGTVYRNLELLAENGLIRKLDVGGSEARFDGCINRHHHIRCLCCDRVDDATEVPVDVIDDRIGRLSGYKIIDHHLEITGICPECRKKEQEKGIP